MTLIYWVVWAASFLGPPPDMAILELICLEKHPTAVIESRMVLIQVKGQNKFAVRFLCVEIQPSEPLFLLEPEEKAL